MSEPRNSWYLADCEKSRSRQSIQKGENRQDNFLHSIEMTTIGERLVQAFEKTFGKVNKKFIAEKLGFGTDKAVYKIIKGDNELNFTQLVNFKNSTKHSIDWLLTGADESSVQDAPLHLNSNQRLFIEKIATNEGISFDEVIGELVNVGLDLKAQKLSISYRALNEDQLKDVLDAFFEHADTLDNREQNKSHGKKSR